MAEIKDENLIERYLKGDEKSLEILIERHLKPVYNFIYHYIGDAPGAEDVAQEVFVRAWRNLGKFNPEKKFKTWLFSIAKNAALDFLKKKKAVSFSELSARGGSALGGENEDGENPIIETLADPAPLPDELLARADLSKLLSVALTQLSPADRGVILLHHYDQFTFEEAAEALGEPLNTVKSRYRRVLFKLRKIMIELRTK